MDQPELPFQRHSQTSRDAALRQEPRAGTQRYRVLELLRSLPNGATDEQMQIALNMNPSTQRPRRIDLVRGGFVADTGRVSQTLSDCSAVVWSAVR